MDTDSIKRPLRLEWALSSAFAIFTEALFHMKGIQKLLPAGYPAIEPDGSDGCSTCHKRHFCFETVRVFVSQLKHLISSTAPGYLNNCILVLGYHVPDVPFVGPFGLPSAS